MREQLIAGLLREGLKVLHRARIRGKDPKYLPAPQLRQGLLGAQDGQRTIETAHIQIFVESRHRRLITQGRGDYIPNRICVKPRGWTCAAWVSGLPKRFAILKLGRR